jgi:hypothetical protein
MCQDQDVGEEKVLTRLEKLVHEASLAKNFTNSLVENV